jgi:hypothetical protein
MVGTSTYELLESKLSTKSIVACGLESARVALGSADLSDLDFQANFKMKEQMVWSFSVYKIVAND